MISFSIQNLPFTDPMLTVWAQLVNLAGSKLEKQRMKKSLSRGLTGTDNSITHNAPDVSCFCFSAFWPADIVNILLNILKQSKTALSIFHKHIYICIIIICVFVIAADQVDVHLLRCQQLRLFILKAARALLSHQDKLRQILSQAAVVDVSPNPPGKTRILYFVILILFCSFFCRWFHIAICSICLFSLMVCLFCAFGWFCLF